MPFPLKIMIEISISKLSKDSQSAENNQDKITGKTGTAPYDGDSTFPIYKIVAVSESMNSPQNI